MKYDTDGEHVFRQEKYFMWFFGIEVPGFSGILDIDSGKTILFMPRLPESYNIWMGKLETPESLVSKYMVDVVMYEDELLSYLKDANFNCLHFLAGLNSDSGAVFQTPSIPDLPEEQWTSAEMALPCVRELRVIKTFAEIEVMRLAAQGSAAALKDVMKITKPTMREYQLEATFCYHIYFHHGMRHTAYTPIAGCGCHSAVLHYGHAGAPNDGLIRDGDMILLDFGGEYAGYCSDITISFPATGKFNAKQKAIYEAVLDANRSVMQAMKPGVDWTEMHLLAEERILMGLQALGLVVPTVDIKEARDAGLGAVFMPHGLGHLLGLDTHDVGGYSQGQPPRLERPGLKALRTRRTLLEGMVITVEPGCYFIDTLLDKALEDPELAPMLNADRVNEFRGFGGVRIEDDVLVTADGMDLLSSGLPRTVEEIEAWMAEGK